MATETDWPASDAIDSADSLSFAAESVPPDDFDFFGGPEDVVQGEIVDGPPDNVRTLKSDKPDPVDRGASSGVPKIDEWMNFFSRVVIRLSTDFYIDMAFRDIDEDQLTDREVERIKLTDVERDRMARPFAEYSNKSKFMRKHGRIIIASADSIDAVIQMGMWFSRVNRIASKYKGTRKTRTPKIQHVRAAPVFRPQPQPAQEEFEDRSDENVSAGSGTPQRDHWRPDIGGPVFNPSGGG